MTDGSKAALPMKVVPSKNALDELFEQNSKPETFARGYLAYLGTILSKLNERAIAAFIEVLLEARKRDAQIFFLGNGGSAATASHFANDIAIGSRSTGKPFRAVSLTDNLAIVTAVANDYGFDEIFTMQLKLHLKPEDVVVAISASGNSPNVLKAVEYANSLGATTVALTGFDGGKLKALAKLGVHAATGKGEYGPTEDVHMILDHLVGAFLIQLCRAEVR